MKASSARRIPNQGRKRANYHRRIKPKRRRSTEHSVTPYSVLRGYRCKRFFFTQIGVSASSHSIDFDATQHRTT